MSTEYLVDAYIGRKIRYIRKKYKITQQQLANELGISYQQLQKYEIGQDRVSASRLFILSQVLREPVSVFLPVQRKSGS